jgi:hypothetical protein
MRGTILKNCLVKILVFGSESVSQKKFLDPNPNKINSDPRHWSKESLDKIKPSSMTFRSRSTTNYFSSKSYQCSNLNFLPELKIFEGSNKDISA